MRPFGLLAGAHRMTKIFWSADGFELHSAS